MDKIKAKYESVWSKLVEMLGKEEGKHALLDSLKKAIVVA